MRKFRLAIVGVALLPAIFVFQNCAGSKNIAPEDLAGTQASASADDTAPAPPATASFAQPTYQSYPLFADDQTAVGYCLSQGFTHALILNSVYVDANPAYYYRNNQWGFSPAADHYNRIDLLSCSR